MIESKRSESIMNLAAALAIAQGQIKTASKDAKGNYSKYSSLDAIWDACRQPLSENGLSIVQIPSTGENELLMETILLHSSGEWISGTISLPLVSGRTNEHQALGSAITYARRYSFAPMVGIASGDDDDGEAARKPDKRNNSQTELSWRDKSPSMDQFLKIAGKEFKLEKDDILDELKAAQFTAYKASRANEMWKALEGARENALAKEVNETSPDQLPMSEAEVVRSAAADDLENEFPEIYADQSE